MVLMNGEMHYEVVLRSRRQAPRLVQQRRARGPAGVGRVEGHDDRDAGRPHRRETLALAIDDSGESWVAAGQPVAGDDVMVKVNYVARGEPFEIEIPVRQALTAATRYHRLRSLDPDESGAGRARPPAR